MTGGAGISVPWGVRLLRRMPFAVALLPLMKRIITAVARSPADIGHAFPSCIRIETTNACNLRCRMCPHGLPSRKVRTGFMDRTLFERIVDQLAEHPESRDAIFYLHICGEPLLHKDILHLIRHAAHRGLKPILTTNATRLTPELSDALLESGLSKVEFSFEGMDRELYETTRVGARYEVVRNNIMTFLEKNRSRGNAVRTELVVVDLPAANVEQTREFCRRMQEHFDVVNLSGYFDWLGKVAPVPFDRGAYRGCSVMVHDLNVLWDGRVVPCCMDVDGAMQIGDFRTMHLREILASGARKRLHARLRDGRIKGLPCEVCATPWAGRRVRGGSSGGEVFVNQAAAVASGVGSDPCQRGPERIVRGGEVAACAVVDRNRPMRAVSPAIQEPRN